MIRDRGSAIIVRGNKIALIKRVRNNEVYFVFPGGGIEEHETPEEATIREVYEELGIHVEAEKLLAKYEYEGTQYFYKVHITSGIFGTGKGEEFKKVESGQYIPVWVPIKDMLNIDIKPDEVSGIIFQYYKNVKSDNIQ
ncbi:NUDIX domain-containing protein [Bacillus sp. DX4.1]|uniref:NUDIX hydrolase n=1 Tax=Bacillus sp. DX4.1 TaxID=3055867 RepID=UPI0025A01D76|nr:NUDIX domain-containing protein [Bacillus sp. DX4.1]MDM5189209.1 NUDIX domain-containing protein [Bacillus sp. DX4.1]